MIEETKNRIIEMAWEDRTPFDAIQDQFGVSEKDVKTNMRKKLSNYKETAFNKLFQTCPSTADTTNNPKYKKYKNAKKHALLPYLWKLTETNFNEVKLT